MSFFLHLARRRGGVSTRRLHSAAVLWNELLGFVHVDLVGFSTIIRSSHVLALTGRPMEPKPDNRSDVDILLRKLLLQACAIALN